MWGSATCPLTLKAGMMDFSGHDIWNDLMLLRVSEIRRSMFRWCWVDFESVYMELFCGVDCMKVENSIDCR